MLIEVTGRTKRCSDCGVVAHNTVMQAHTCEVKVVKEKVKPKAKKK